MYMVARLDGRSFTRLTREVHQFAAPFDERFRDLMRETTAHVMRAVSVCSTITHNRTKSRCSCIALSRPLAASCGSTNLFSPEASAKFALLRGAHAAFDCRISRLPNAEPVVDYFRWRSAGAHRNALNGHCYWLLRKQKALSRLPQPCCTCRSRRKMNCSSRRGSTLMMCRSGMGGIGLYWETYEKPAYNPKAGEPVAAVRRRRLQGDYQLPMKERYSDFIATLLAAVSSTMHGSTSAQQGGAATMIRTLDLVAL